MGYEGRTQRESDVAEEKEKRCVVRMDAIRVVRNACRVRWLLSSLTRESLTNARFLFLSLSLPFSLPFYRSRGILFYDDLRAAISREAPAVERRAVRIAVARLRRFSAQSALQFRRPTRPNWQRERYAANHAAGIKRRKEERNGRL